MAPPHFQGSVGGGKSCAQRTLLMLPEKPSKLGFLQHSHPLRDITGYHPNYFLLRFRATRSIPTSNRSSSRFSIRRRTGPPQARLPGASQTRLPGASQTPCRHLPGTSQAPPRRRRLPAPFAETFRGLQGLPGVPAKGPQKLLEIPEPASASQALYIFGGWEEPGGALRPFSIWAIVSLE